jgi:hypothetical protein
MLSDTGGEGPEAMRTNEMTPKGTRAEAEGVMGFSAFSAISTTNSFVRECP